MLVDTPLDWSYSISGPADQCVKGDGSIRTKNLKTYTHIITEEEEETLRFTERYDLLFANRQRS